MSTFSVRKVRIVTPARKVRTLDDINGGKQAALKEKAEKKAKGITKALKLRPSITPGTILILLVGKHKGKRVVFLKQLPSGLLLVTGPSNINRVPFERVEQTRVISTSTKIDIPEGILKSLESVEESKLSGKDLANANKKKQQEEKDKKKAGDEFFEKENKKSSKKNEKTKVDPQIKSLQDETDAKLLALIQKVPHLEAYLSTKFTLMEGQAPHLMKF